MQAERPVGPFVRDPGYVYSQGAGEDPESGRLHGRENRGEGAVGGSAARALAETELECLFTNRKLGYDPTVFVWLVFFFFFFLHVLVAAARAVAVAAASIILSVFIVIVKRGVISRGVQILLHFGNEFFQLARPECCLPLFFSINPFTTDISPFLAEL